MWDFFGKSEERLVFRLKNRIDVRSTDPESMNVSQKLQEVFNDLGIKLKIEISEKIAIKIIKKWDKIKQYFLDKKDQKAQLKDFVKSCLRKRESVKKHREIGQEVPYETFHTIDPHTGYRVLIAVPDGFDGSLKMYFPGDGTGLEKALRNDVNLKGSGQVQAMWKSGNRGALMIVEGNKRAIHENKAQRYSSIRKKGAFDSLVTTAGNSINQDITKVDLLAYSRGGSAVNHILNAGGNPTSISLFDATYWSAGPLKKYAENGGVLNVAFRPGTKTAKQGEKLVGENVKVCRAVKGTSHRGVREFYLTSFLSNTRENNRNNVSQSFGVTDNTNNTNNKEKSVVESAEFVEGHVEKKPKTLMEFYNWANNLSMNRKKDIYSLRTAERKKLIKAYFLNEKGKALKSIVAGVKVKVDFKGNSLAEKRLGAGDILPPTVKKIKIYKDGKVIFNNVIRRVVNGRVGYFTSSGRYAYIHTGYEIEILETQSDSHKETIKRMEREEKVRKKKY